MDWRQRVFWGVLAGLILLGLLIAEPLAALRCGAPWLDPLLNLAVAVPAVYSIVFIVFSLRDARRKGPVESLYKKRARSLAELAGQVPPPIVVVVILGLGLQVMVWAGELRIAPVCGG